MKLPATYQQEASYVLSIRHWVLTYCRSMEQPYGSYGKPQPATYPTAYPCHSHPAQDPHTPVPPNPSVQSQKPDLSHIPHFSQLFFAPRTCDFLQKGGEAHSPLIEE